MKNEIIRLEKEKKKLENEKISLECKIKLAIKMFKNIYNMYGDILGDYILDIIKLLEEDVVGLDSSSSNFLLN
jgi:hypothetical protein